MTFSKEDIKIVQSVYGNIYRYTIEVMLDGRIYTLQDKCDLDVVINIRDDLITREDL